MKLRKDSFEEYRNKRTEENRKIKEKLLGTVFWYGGQGTYRRRTTPKLTKAEIKQAKRRTHEKRHYFIVRAFLKLTQ